MNRAGVDPADALQEPSMETGRSRKLSDLKSAWGEAAAKAYHAPSLEQVQRAVKSIMIPAGTAAEQAQAVGEMLTGPIPVTAGSMFNRDPAYEARARATAEKRAAEGMSQMDRFALERLCSTYGTTAVLSEITKLERGAA